MNLTSNNHFEEKKTSKDSIIVITHISIPTSETFHVIGEVFQNKISE